MKVKVTKNEWFGVHNGIMKLVDGKEKYSMQFSYFLSKNKRILSEEIETITTQIQDKLKNYREEMKESKIIDDKDQITDMKKFKEIEDKYKTDKEEVNKFLKEELELEIFSINLDKVDSIPSVLFDLIFPLVVDVKSN
jgi:hypothetical protein